jgi:hypothetical protein
MLQNTVIKRLMFWVTVFTALFCNIFQQWMFLCWHPSHTNLLFRLPAQDCSVMAAGPCYVALSWTAQKTSLPLLNVITVVITWQILSHCLATAKSAEPFPSNSCLCWVHNSGFQQICHIIFSSCIWHDWRSLWEMADTLRSPLMADLRSTVKCLSYCPWCANFHCIGIVIFMKTASHNLYDCWDLANLRFHYLGLHFKEQDEQLCGQRFYWLCNPGWVLASSVVF